MTIEQDFEMVYSALDVEEDADERAALYYIQVEIERLRRALKKITSETFMSRPHPGGGFCVPSRLAHEWRTIARQTLEKNA
jgi:hypothetical protein